MSIAVALTSTKDGTRTSCERTVDNLVSLLVVTMSWHFGFTMIEDEDQGWGKNAPFLYVQLGNNIVIIIYKDWLASDERLECRRGGGNVFAWIIIICCGAALAFINDPVPVLVFDQSTIYIIQSLECCQQVEAQRCYLSTSKRQLIIHQLMLCCKPCASLLCLSWIEKRLVQSWSALSIKVVMFIFDNHQHLHGIDVVWVQIDRRHILTQKLRFKIPKKHSPPDHRLFRCSVLIARWWYPCSLFCRFGSSMPEP